MPLEEGTVRFRLIRDAFIKIVHRQARSALEKYIQFKFFSQI